MRDAPIHVGDRVVNPLMPGLFRVVSRQGHILEIETDDGVRMTVLESAVRRIDAA
ncbi:MAG: hypothetical protein U0807_14670 [Candidatus Binatia bacterium]